MTPRRVVAKVEWRPGELYPRVGFIVTNMTRPAERVVAFYNQRGTAEQWIKEGKNTVKWTRLSCCSFAANAVRLQLHALAYNLANFTWSAARPANRPASHPFLQEQTSPFGAASVATEGKLRCLRAECRVRRPRAARLASPWHRACCGSWPAWR